MENLIRRLRLKMWGAILTIVLSVVCLALWTLAIIFMLRGEYQMATFMLVAQLSLLPTK